MAEYGWNDDRLDELHDFLRDSANTTGLVVADRGRMVFSFGAVEQLSYLPSVRKSTRVES